MTRVQSFLKCDSDPKRIIDARSTRLPNEENSVEIPKPCRVCGRKSIEIRNVQLLYLRYRPPIFFHLFMSGGRAGDLLNTNDIITTKP